MKSVRDVFTFSILGVLIGSISCLVDKLNKKEFSEVKTKEKNEKIEVTNDVQSRRVPNMQKTYHNLVYTELIFEKAYKSPVVLQKNVYTDRHYTCKIALTKEADNFEFYHYHQNEIRAILTAVNRSILKQLDCNIEFGKIELLPITHKMCIGENTLEESILAFQEAEIIGIKDYHNSEDEKTSFIEELYQIMPSLIGGEKVK